MKYNTFRNLLAGGGALVATALVFYSCSGESNTSSNATNTNKATGGYKTSAAPGATITTEDIMKMFETPSNGSQKMKDAFSKSSTKVNLYDDKGTGKWNRAKVDYDRDEQDDEKWERDAVTGQITRVVSVNDDGNFGPQQTWNGTAFVP